MSPTKHTSHRDSTVAHRNALVSNFYPALMNTCWFNLLPLHVYLGKTGERLDEPVLGIGPTSLFPVQLPSSNFSMRVQWH